MKVNADLGQRALVRTGELDWIPSPAAGVYRKMLDRDGGEVARATSLVRFDPHCAFPEHEHGGGEEFLVLEGGFRDESGTYPAGSYVRNPMGSRHSPSSESGCVILVKLHQMTNPNEPPVVILPTNRTWEPTDVPGVQCCPLYTDPSGPERVCLLRWDGAASLSRAYPAGAESFVLQGETHDGEEHYRSGDWLRLPPGSSHSLGATPGTVLWLKHGHLAPHASAPRT